MKFFNSEIDFSTLDPFTSLYETNIWLNHFEDQTVGEALLDRIIHRAHVFKI